MHKSEFSKFFKALEFIVLYVLIPVSLFLQYNIYLKVVLVLIAFVYIIIILKKSKSVRFRMKKNLDWKSFCLRVSCTFLLLSITSFLYVWFQDKEALFYVPRTYPGLFVLILVVYTFLSVWPQEIVYRTFFFERYKVFFKNKLLFVCLNAIVFSLAHLFFRNTLVLILTFIGGLLFGYTYLKYRSTTAVSIEHALYGNWLFTVGMGEMLAFPGMEG
ncbi:MAG: CPBP family intramembrane metalloprotease [Flavobacteriaceae bacterium]|nr:CPBP family intramembrane metalloprotease [Flavobacteriaceae bacterium]